MDPKSMLDLHDLEQNIEPAEFNELVQLTEPTFMERMFSFLFPPEHDLHFTKEDLSGTWNYHYRLNRSGVDKHPDALTASLQHLEVMEGRRIRSQREIYDQHLIACRICAEAASENAVLCVVGRELKRRVRKELPPRSDL